MSRDESNRRSFLQYGSAFAAWAAVPTRPAVKAAAAPQADRSQVKRRKPYVAIQIGAVSFVDEGTEKVLDILQKRAHVNTLWLNTYTYERGTGGRQLRGPSQTREPELLQRLG